MPVYTYICRDCGEKFDLLTGVTIEKVEIKCRKCNSRNVEKTYAVFSMGKSGSKSDSSGFGSCPTGTCPSV